MHNDVHTSGDFWELLRMWWNGEVPLGGVALAMVMAVLRIAYTGGGWKRMLLEGALCGALTLMAASALEYFVIPKSLTVALGGAIGFIGADQIRAVALCMFNSRFGNSNTKE